MVVCVDFGRQKVGMDNVLVATGIPQARMVLHHVITQCNNQVRRIQSAAPDILRGQAHSKQAVVGVHVNAALGHEGTDHTDTGFLTEAAQLFAGAPAYAAIAGDNNRTFGITELLEGLVEDKVIRDRPAEQFRLQRHGSGVIFGYVFRQFNQAGTRLLGTSNAYRLAHDLRDGVFMQHTHCPLGHRLKHRHHIHDLMRLLVQARRSPLPG